VNAEFAKFLADSLALWQVEGEVEVDELPAVAVIHARGIAVSIEQNRADNAPWRWCVRWRDAGMDEERSRPCASLTGMLNGVRRALGVERGAAVRIAPAPPEAPAADGAASPAFPRAASRLAPNGSIPVSVITGFLGSGKTTLLARLLRHPAMARTAVIINEFGAVGLDHDLVEASDESFIELSNGCLCCNVRSDLVLTLGDLAARRDAGTVPRFERVVIETTGLADPAPILHALMTDRGLSQVYALDGVITTVDAITGFAALDAHPESLRQAAVADRLLLTKTDAPEAQTFALRERLGKINPGAPVIQVVDGAVAPAELFDCGFYDVAGKHPDVQSWLADESHAAAGSAVHHHRDDITSFCVVREHPLCAVTLPLLLSALAENCGGDLLRMKGIVDVVEAPNIPAVIHGVQHVYHAPAWLPRWPSADRRTRMVFIGRKLRESWVRRLIDLIDIEVAAENARRSVAATV
jgi:G3E family GTPase